MLCNLICASHTIDGNEKRINSISLFQHNIKPMWEDEVNYQGGEFQINFGCSKLEVLQDLWERMIFRVVTGVFPHTDLLCGMRFLDKSKGGMENTFRIEVWVKFADESLDQAKVIKDYLRDHFAMVIYECPEANILGGNKHLQDKDKWVVFKPHSSAASKAHQYEKKHAKSSAIN